MSLTCSLLRRHVLPLLFRNVKININIYDTMGASAIDTPSTHDMHDFVAFAHHAQLHLVVKTVMLCARVHPKGEKWEGDIAKHALRNIKETRKDLLAADDTFQRDFFLESAVKHIFAVMKPEVLILSIIPTEWDIAVHTVTFHRSSGPTYAPGQNTNTSAAKKPLTPVKQVQPITSQASSPTSQDLLPTSQASPSTSQASPSTSQASPSTSQASPSFSQASQVVSQALTSAARKASPLFNKKYWSHVTLNDEHFWVPTKAYRYFFDHTPSILYGFRDLSAHLFRLRWAKGSRITKFSFISPHWPLHSRDDQRAANRIQQIALFVTGAPHLEEFAIQLVGNYHYDKKKHYNGWLAGMYRCIAGTVIAKGAQSKVFKYFKIGVRDQCVDGPFNTEIMIDSLLIPEGWVPLNGRQWANLRNTTDVE